MIFLMVMLGEYVNIIGIYFIYLYLIIWSDHCCLKSLSCFLKKSQILVILEAFWTHVPPPNLGIFPLPWIQLYPAPHLFQKLLDPFPFGFRLGIPHELNIKEKQRGIMGKSCENICEMCVSDIWWVVWKPLKNISQWEGLSHILWKINNVPNHQPDI
jgi:hypothetical protein